MDRKGNTAYDINAIIALYSRFVCLHSSSSDHMCHNIFCFLDVIA
jgi:hypothetical protein